MLINIHYYCAQKMYKESVFILQMNQHEHDKIYHYDILHLSTKDRAKHLVLHFVKYLASLENAESEIVTKKNITDFMICILSMANLLNVNLSEIDTQLIESSMLAMIGKMAKACEALDHIEPFPSHEVLIAELKNLYCYLLKMCHSNNLDLHKSIVNRWNDIEQKSIFNSHLETNRANQS
jgi:hypothetical protein